MIVRECPSGRIVKPDSPDAITVMTVHDMLIQYWGTNDNITKNNSITFYCFNDINDIDSINNNIAKIRIVKPSEDERKWWGLIPHPVNGILSYIVLYIKREITFDGNEPIIDDISAYIIDQNFFQSISLKKYADITNIDWKSRFKFLDLDRHSYGASYTIMNYSDKVRREIIFYNRDRQTDESLSFIEPSEAISK